MKILKDNFDKQTRTAIYLFAGWAVILIIGAVLHVKMLIYVAHLALFASVGLMLLPTITFFFGDNKKEITERNNSLKSKKDK